MAFITVEELGSLLGRDLSSDDGAQLAVDIACSVCEDVAGQTLVETSETILLDGTGTDVLVLPGFPVGSVTSVSVGGTADTSYVADNGLLLKQSGVWRKGRRNIAVKYKHGFKSNAVPDSVRGVALELARRLVVQGPALSEVIGDVQVRYAIAADDLTANERRILRRHAGK